MRRSDSRTLATFDLEAVSMKLTGGRVAGVDEAGRGPWAGPVVAAAVILDPERIPAGIADSKALTPAARDQLHDAIRRTSVVGVAVADVERIDRDNILQATLWAMREAVSLLAHTPSFALIDGNRMPKLDCPAQTVVQGDARCLSIAAASVIAKVTRDRLMEKLGEELPGYGFERHKGYGTPEHQAAISRFGVSRHHRRSFRPIQLALRLEEQTRGAA